MKKLLSAMIFLAVVTFVHAQNVIPNPGFEIWNVSSYPDPDGWGTINPLTSLIGVQTATKATAPADIHGGTAALKLESKQVPSDVFPFPLQTAPGIAGLGVITRNTDGAEDFEGVGYTKRPISLTGWYKYQPGTGDTCNMEIVLFKWNTTTQSRQRVGEAQFTQHLTVNSYTQFTAPIIYSLPDYPDTMVIILLTSSQGSASPVGSKLFIDDLALELCTGFSVTASSTNSTCTASDGSAIANVTAGTSPLTYSWSGGGSTATVAKPAGTYTVTVTDGNACSVTASTTVTANVVALSATPSSTAATCTAADGSASVAVSLGTGPYTYAWSNNATASSITNVVADTYTVSAYDINGCSVSASVIVSANNTPINVSTTSTQSSCTVNTGSAHASTTDGTQPYTFVWSVPGTADSITNVGAGNYNVTITDANGCSGSAVVAVTTPNGPSATSIKTDVLCNGGSDGSVSVDVIGGAAPIDFLWNSGETTEDLNNLSAGNYCLVITDVNNCSFQLCDSVSEPAPLVISESHINVLCFGGSDGEINISATGGASGFTYLWDDGSVSEDRNNLDTGSYCVILTDANSCTAAICAVLTEPSVLTATETHTDVLCNGGNTGSISVTASGGTSPFSYTWSSGNGTSLTAGTVTVTVADANSCSVSLSATISEPAPLIVTSVVTNATSSTAADGSVSLSTSGGTAPYTVVWSTGSGTNLAPGAYCYTVTDANSCVVTRCDTVSFLSVISNVSGEAIKLYPNPANNRIVIETNSIEGKFSFSVYDLEGRLTEETEISGDKTVVDVKHLPTGLYTYQLRNISSGKTICGKLQIER